MHKYVINHRMNHKVLLNIYTHFFFNAIFCFIWIWRNREVVTSKDFLEKLSLLCRAGVAPQFPSLLPPFLRSFCSKAAGSPRNLLWSQAWLNVPSICPCGADLCVLFLPTSADAFANSRLFPDPSPSFLVGHYSGFSLSVHDEEPFILCPASFLSCSATSCPVSFFSAIIGKLKTFVEFLQNVSSFLDFRLFFLVFTWVCSVLRSLINCGRDAPEGVVRWWLPSPRECPC